MHVLTYQWLKRLTLDATAGVAAVYGEPDVTKPALPPRVATKSDFHWGRADVRAAACEGVSAPFVLCSVDWGPHVQNGAS